MQFPVPSETFASLDVKALMERGHQVHIGCLRPRDRNYGRLMAERHPEGLLVVHSGMFQTALGIAKSFKRPLRSLALLRWIIATSWRNPIALFKAMILVPAAIQLVDWIHDQKPDVVHLFWGHYPAIVGRLILMDEDRPVLTTFLGAIDIASRLGAATDLANRSDALFTHAAVNVEILTRRGVDSAKIQVVHRGIQIPTTNPESHRWQNEEGLKLLVAGRLVAGKGVDDVLRALVQLVCHNVSFELTIAGEGPERQALERLATSLGVIGRCRFIGQVPQSKLFTLMESSDYLLLMSKSEGERLPNVLKEAMLRGCVCISSRSIGVEELIEDNETGFLVDVGDFSALAKKLMACEQDRSVFERVRANAIRHVSRNFDIEKSMIEYESKWKQLLSRKRSSAQQQD